MMGGNEMVDTSKGEAVVVAVGGGVYVHGPVFSSHREGVRKGGMKIQGHDAGVSFSDRGDDVSGGGTRHDLQALPSLRGGCRGRVSDDARRTARGTSRPRRQNAGLAQRHRSVRASQRQQDVRFRVRVIIPQTRRSYRERRARGVGHSELGPRSNESRFRGSFAGIDIGADVDVALRDEALLRQRGIQSKPHGHSSPQLRRRDDFASGRGVLSDVISRHVEGGVSQFQGTALERGGDVVVLVAAAFAAMAPRNQIFVERGRHGGSVEDVIGMEVLFGGVSEGVGADEVGASRGEEAEDGGRSRGIV
mmetsp:Transcript_21873/g.45528  ORF Transcript_21873/g.45528 Transcript_21873/m.45528 type:complete len:306 (-) Transcript_21873:160-1077(-)